MAHLTKIRLLSYSTVTTKLWRPLQAYHPNEAAEAPKTSGVATGNFVNKKRAGLDPIKLIDFCFRLII